MRKSLKQPRVLVAFVGVLVLLASLAFVAGSARPTEATWQDTVHGESVFGAANLNEGKHFARSISAFGAVKQRNGTVRNLGPSQREALPSTDWRAPARVTDAWNSESAGNLVSAIRATAETRTCARRESRATGNCNPLQENSQATSYAVSELRNLEVRALAIFVPVPLVTSTATPIRATASCTPGQDGRANLTSDRLSLGGFLGAGTPIDIPERGQIAPLTPRDIGAHTYSGVIEHVWEEKPGYAKSQLRLYVEAIGDLTKSEAWTFHAVLAHAECGISQPVTKSPDRPSPDSSTFEGRQVATTTMASLRMIHEDLDSPTVEAPLVLPTEDTSAADEAEGTSDLKTLDGVANDVSTPETDSNSGVATATTAATSPTTLPPTRSATSATPTIPVREVLESAADSAKSDLPTEDVAPEPTEQTAVAEGPQEPESVRIGQEFAVVNREGIELGTAKVEDIVRTPGCGVELTLSITTSDEAGPDRWAAIEPTDFAEVRPGGSIRKASRLNSDCEQAATSRTTALSPGRDYEIVIAFQLSDTAQRAMLQPDGTAGWIFDLPPLPRVTVTTSAKAPAPASATTAAPATSSAPSTSATSEEPAAAAAEV